MSRYRIYQIDHFDPVIIGKRKRVSAGILGAISMLFIILFQVFIQVLHIHYLLVLGTLPVILAFLLYLNSRFKGGLKKINTIGEIEFTRNHINKRLGDLFISYDFQSIKELELRKHIPEISSNDSKSGYFSYILKIVFKDSASESLVVSDRPVDTDKDLSIVETMKTLKKIISPGITIIS